MPAADQPAELDRLAGALHDTAGFLHGQGDVPAAADPSHYDAAVIRPAAAADAAAPAGEAPAAPDDDAPAPATDRKDHDR